MFKFELQYYWRRPVFRLATILFFLLGAGCVQGGFGGPEVAPNGPYVATVVTGLLSLFCIFVSTVFCADVVLRDVTYRMEPLIFTTAIDRRSYIAARFGGLWMAVSIVICAAVVGMLPGAILRGNTWPFQLRYYLQPLLVFGLPNVIFVCTITFATAMLTRSVKMVYLSGVLLFIAYMLAAILGNSPLLAGSPLKEASDTFLTDPFGLSCLFGSTRQWSDVRKNTQLVPLKGVLLANRLLWMGVSLLALLAAFRWFRFRVPREVRRERIKADSSPVAQTWRPAEVKPGFFVSLLAQWKQEVNALFRHVPFLLMVLLWVFLFYMEMKDGIFNGPFGIRLYPLTGLLVDELRVVRPVMLLLIFYAAEISGRERAVNMEALVYSTPVHRGAIWLAKWACMVCIVLLVVTCNIMAAVFIQWQQGYVDIDLPLYAGLYWYCAVPLCWFAVLTLFVHSIVRGKYTAMLINLALAGIIVFGRRLGLEHDLFRFAGAPDMSWAQMDGWGQSAYVFNWYMLFWGLCSVALLLCCVRAWRQALPFAVLAWMGVGAYIFYKTNIEGHYQSRHTAEQWRADYERRYKSQAPTPVITAISARIALYPAKGEYTVEGRYLLQNNTPDTLHSLTIGWDPDITAYHIRNLACLQQNDTLRQYRYWVQLAPGDTMSLRFDMRVVRSGFMPFNSEHSVSPNGSYIELEKYLPYLGYNDRYEISDRATRKRLGLKTVALVQDSENYRIQYDAEISTDLDQQVVTVGDEQRSWQEVGRRYYHYKTSQPIRYMLALSSAKYAVRREMYKGIRVNLFYHPQQTVNLDALMQGMKDALDYGRAGFGDYPYRQLTLAAIPHYRGQANAYPGVIFSAENASFTGNFRDTTRPNHAYAITAHETAHQWWAHQLTPRYGPGAAMLTETLAMYTELMVLERRIGRDKMGAYLQAQNRVYFLSRDAEEVPLNKVDGQTYVYYQKGALAMYALRNALGEQQINSVLRQLLREHQQLRASPADLITLLVGKGDATLVKEWLQQIIIYDASAEIMECRAVTGGGYEVKVKINLEKTDGGQEVTPDDQLDLALYAHDTLCYRQTHQLTKKETILTLQVQQRPDKALIDPDGGMLNMARYK